MQLQLNENNSISNILFWKTWDFTEKTEVAHKYILLKDFGTPQYIVQG